MYLICITPACINLMYEINKYIEQIEIRKQKTIIILWKPITLSPPFTTQSLYTFERLEIFELASITQIKYLYLSFYKYCINNGSILGQQDLVKLNNHKLQGDFIYQLKQHVILKRQYLK